MDSSMQGFNLCEASIEDHRRALDAGLITAVELVTKYLIRIATYDCQGPCLNSFTIINPKVLMEAQASDERRAKGLSLRPLEGIPYTLKDSYKYEGLTVACGSPAFDGLMSSGDSFLASKLREAGAILLGKTNMPPMAAGGMQRGLYGRALSPYNTEYLTAAFASGSSNGAATSTAAGFAVFALGSETVSSGRSPASNNGLVAYTPSRGVLSCRGLWPLYGTCDVPVPYTRTIKDMMEILQVLSQKDDDVQGDFWREQPHVKLPDVEIPDYINLADADSLRGKRIGVPRMYIGEYDPAAKPVTTSTAVISLWSKARRDLEALGAEVILTDFPLVTRYEDDRVSHQANNVVGVPSNWNAIERGIIIAKAWDDFLLANNDARFPSLTTIAPEHIFPKPTGYIPDLYMEAKNALNYPDLVELAKNHSKTNIYSLEGMSTALPALEAQRKRDFENWMDDVNLDLIVFPANGDVGKADLETNSQSAEFAIRNGVRYSNGNRAIRHLGVPTVNVTMGLLGDKGMPCNLTFAGRAYDDAKLLRWGYAFENSRHRRVSPPLTPELKSDVVEMSGVTCEKTGMAKIIIENAKKELILNGKWTVRVRGKVYSKSGDRNIMPEVKVYIQGKEVQTTFVGGKKTEIEMAGAFAGDEEWEAVTEYETPEYIKLTDSEKPLLKEHIITLATVRNGGVFDAALTLV